MMVLRRYPLQRFKGTQPDNNVNVAIQSNDAKLLVTL